MAMEEEKGYVYLHGRFYKYLKELGIDPNRFLDKIYPYALELALRGYLKIKMEFFENEPIIEIFPGSEDYKALLENIDRTINEIKKKTSYIC